jgi:hypothetical protein
MSIDSNVAGVNGLTPGASTAQTEAASAQSSGTSTSAGTSLDTAAKVSSMADLKTKAPEVYNGMLMGIATTMIQHMQRQQEHLKQMMREGQRNSQGG